ncbi:hypothetical protein FE257_002306 [Aspergillus nanangensis]|uniref:PNPLA domain-containing protein n=1 Tax=Aspergillus nanangensis TaxID=2582783 RepID=A0AAD4CCU2_ASPNN|nr:hypothetical protein FE257_002306 [Aspergillus nanangensis]
MTTSTWIHVTGDQWVDLYAPFEELDNQECVVPCAPAIVTVTSPQDKASPGGGYAISTVLKQGSSHSVVYNRMGGTGLWDSKVSRVTGGPGREKQRFRLREDSCPQAFGRKLSWTFSDVICIVTASVTQAIEELCDWILIDRPGSQHRPFVALVTEQDYLPHRDGPTFHGFIREQCWNRLCGKTGLGTSGPSAALEDQLDQFLSRLSLHRRPPEEEAIGETLCERLHSLIVNAREERKTHGHLWALPTFVSLVDEFCSYSTAVHAQPFDYIAALRKEYWPGGRMREESVLADWLCVGDCNRPLESCIAPLIASLFLEDASQLSHKFPPPATFAALYRPLCEEALHRAAGRSDWAAGITPERLFAAILQAMDGHDAPRVRQLWGRLTGLSLCCLCPWSRARVFLSCGHGLCERDAWRYSTRREAYATLSHFLCCPACGATVNCRIRLRPVQAGYRIATFDGGGVLGIVPLVSLDSIVQKLPFGLRAHHYFDIIVGTSTGSIIACAIGVNQWPLQRCIDEFTRAAKHVFQRASAWASALRVLWTDAKYRHRSLYDALQNIFEHEPLRRQCTATEDPVHVAVTTTDLDGGLHLFRSYWSGHRADDGLAPEGRIGSTENGPVWKCIAASCAVPYFLPPMDQLQDGALVANNPSAVARAEARGLWGDQMPDYAACFGTGQFRPLADRPDPSLPRAPGWLRRLVHCFLRGLDAELMYRRFTAQLSRRERGRYHRINPNLPCEPVDLDDVSAIPRLHQRTGEQMADDVVTAGHVNLRLSMVASLFYPVLTSTPIFDRHTGLYHVPLTILSRWEDDVSVSTRLYAYLQGASFWVQGWKYKPVTPLPVMVTLPSLEESITVELQLKDGKRSQISGLPLTVRRLRLLQPNIYLGRRGPQAGVKRSFTDESATKDGHKYARISKPDSCQSVLQFNVDGLHSKNQASV